MQAGEYTTLPVALQPSDVALQGSFTIYLGANRGRGQAYPTGKLVNGESIVLSCQLSGEWLYVRLYPRCDHEDVMPFFSPLQEWIPLLHWRCDQLASRLSSTRRWLSHRPRVVARFQGQPDIRPDKCCRLPAYASYRPATLNPTSVA